MANKKAPELRFKGFTDDWEQRELGEVVEFYSGLTYSPDNVVKQPGTLVLRSSNVQDGEIIDADNVYVNNEVVNCMNVQVGDITVVVRNGSRSLIGKHAAIKYSMKDTVIGAFMTGIRSDTPAFTNALLDTQQFNIEITKNLGATINQITTGNFKKMTFKFPKISEQLLIGDLFNQLDNTITLHQRKLESIRSLKSAYLQQMFPSDIEKVPKLRFANFTDSWEQRKLENHAIYRRGSFPQPYGNKEWYDGKDSMPFVQVVDVDTNLKLVKDTKQKISALAQQKSVFVPAGKVIVTLQGSIGRVAITQYGAYFDRTILIFEDYQDASDDYFWAYSIQRKFDVEKEKAPGGTIKTITKAALSEFEVAIPSIHEQKKIGLLLNHLDNSIALHQQKLERLSKIKSAYLQKMFI